MKGFPGMNQFPQISRKRVLDRIKQAGYDDDALPTQVDAPTEFPLYPHDGQKTLNLFSVDQEIEKILGELAEDRGRNEELTQAIHSIQVARYLIKVYSDRLRVTPNN